MAVNGPVSDDPSRRQTEARKSQAPLICRAFRAFSPASATHGIFSADLKTTEEVGLKCVTTTMELEEFRYRPEGRRRPRAHSRYLVEFSAKGRDPATSTHPASARIF